MAIQSQFGQIGADLTPLLARQRPQSPIEGLLQGFSQGQQAAALPQQLQDQALARQLNNMILQQKINDLQNPDQALAREINKQLQLEAVFNPQKRGLVGGLPTDISEQIATPNAVGATLSELNAAQEEFPSMAAPSAAPGAPITPLMTALGQPTGFGTNPDLAEIPKGDIRTVGNNLIQIDPRTGKSSVLFTAPEKADKERQPTPIQVIRPDGTIGVEALKPGESLPSGTVPVNYKGEKSAHLTLTHDANNQPFLYDATAGTLTPAQVPEGFQVGKPEKPPKPLPTKIADNIANATTAVNNLITLKSYIDSPDVQGLSGPVAGRTIGANPFSATAQNFEGVRGTAKQVIGKYLEGGVLRREDERKYEQIIPGLKMIPETQQNQTNELYRSLRKKLETDLNAYQKSGYDVTELQGALQSLDDQFKNAGSTSGIPTARTKAEYDALPAGKYIGPDGKVATKR